MSNRDLVLPPHLRSDAPSATCSACQRKTYNPGSFGMTCKMTQPGGGSCGGRLVADTGEEDGEHGD